ncbi:hypothetical protein IRJ41_021492 [Triplophysa rosa]|uniref:HECT domain-containing protein n=1 Tax=Triplophysa rosa TaxID=992332 RepID=A0A9W7WRP0_TRIRA|nr:hypothetical protein IRJ41_021492 [Triplophysa rosa]
MTAAAKLLPYEHMPCIAHMLQRSINVSLSNSGFANVLAKCRKIVGHFRHSAANTMELQAQQAALGQQQEPLIQDVPTRWNSTLEMIKRLNRNQAAIKATLDQQHHKLVMLTPQEWDKLQILSTLLEPCRLLMMMMRIVLQTLDYESSPPCGTPVQQNQGPDMECPDDVLSLMASRVDDCKDFKICVSRTDFYQRAMLQWQRQKRGSPANTLRVTFLGEAGVDTGAIRKEFLTDLIGEIEKHLFEHRGHQREKSPIYSLSNLEKGFFRTAGEVFSVSLAFNLSCLHATLRLIPLLKQIRKGLQVYNFVDILENHSGLCKQFFVPGVVDEDDDKADADFIMQNILPKISEKGSVRETSETAIINFLQDFLQEIESCCMCEMT